MYRVGSYSFSNPSNTPIRALLNAHRGPLQKHNFIFKSLEKFLQDVPQDEQQKEAYQETYTLFHTIPYVLCLFKNGEIQLVAYDASTQSLQQWDSIASIPDSKLVYCHYQNGKLYLLYYNLMVGYKLFVYEILSHPSTFTKDFEYIFENSLLPSITKENLYTTKELSGIIKANSFFDVFFVVMNHSLSIFFNHRKGFLLDLQSKIAHMNRIVAAEWDNYTRIILCDRKRIFRTSRYVLLSMVIP